MSTSSNIPLGSLRLQSRRRADLENNPFVSDAEFNDYITASQKELYDKLVSAYGNDYHVATTYSFTTGNAQTYPLPDGTTTYRNSDGGVAQKFYKLLGVDLQYSASPSGYVTLRRFEFIERNKYAYPNTAINWNGYSNLRYRVEGNNLMFIPVPQSGQTARLWYIPAPTSLQFTLICSTTLSSGVVNMSDTYGLTAGMNAYFPSTQQTYQISAVGSTSVLLVGSATASLSNTVISFWDDATTLDGISGWEEYVILSSAIKAKIKQEDDISNLAAQLQGMTDRIASMSEGRDAGQAHHVSDALGAQSMGWGMGGDEPGWDW